MSFHAFLTECLTLPYKPNGKPDYLHETQVKELLDKHELTYAYQPNGSQQSPDFIVYKDNRVLAEIECKSCASDTKPMYNSGLPKQGVIYIFSSKKTNATTFYFPEDIITQQKYSLYELLVKDLRAVVDSYRTRPDWQDDRGFDFYMRSMFTQSGSASKTNYFTHADRQMCEQNVLLRFLND